MTVTVNLAVHVFVLMRVLVTPVFVFVVVGGGLVMRLARPVFVLVRVFNAPMAMRVRMPDGSRHPARVPR
jgi:hypothetical protein